MTLPWHALLAPLPAEAIVERKPLLPPELASRPESAAIAGWSSVSVSLSAGEAGLRHVLVTLDGDGTPISAGDTVLYRNPSAGQVVWTHHSIGGRLEADGTFLGTRWRSVAVGPPDSDEAPTVEQEKSAPSAADVQALKALVAEILARSAGSGSVPEP